MVSYGTEFGFCVHQFNELQAELIRDSGSKWVRTDIETINETNGPVVRKMDGYQNYGQKLLGIIDYWTIPPRIRANFTIEDWENVLTAVATKFKGIIKAYEIWSEPDGIMGPPATSGYQNGPDHYFEMLKVAYNTIKGIDPNAIVIAGALTNPVNETFSLRILQLGASNYMDVFSIHTYSHLLQQNYSLLVSRYFELSGKPIWITEIGYPASTPAQEQSQADFMRAHFTELVNGKVKPEVILWYMCRDDPTWHDAESSEAMGVLYANFTPKLAYQVFKNFANNASLP